MIMVSITQRGINMKRKKITGLAKVAKEVNARAKEGYRQSVVYLDGSALSTVKGEPLVSVKGRIATDKLGGVVQTGLLLAGLGRCDIV